MVEKLDPLRDNFLTMVKKHNALVDAVNGILDYAPLEMAMKAEPKPTENVTQDRMIGCTTLDIPESYIKSCRMDKEFAEEEMERLQKDYDLAVQHAKTMTETCLGYKAKLDIAVDALKDIRCIYTGDQTTKPSTMFGRAASALNKIQDLEQKDAK